MSFFFPFLLLYYCLAPIVRMLNTNGVDA